MINPTWAGVMAKLSAIALRSPTGTNSVVLKIKAASAMHSTRSQALERLVRGVNGGRALERREEWVVCIAMTANKVEMSGKHRAP
ncbi:hypothetical protein SODG_002379 [Sodalis praecaptivus]